MAISAGPLFTFNESISFIVHCDTREQIDHYRGLLSAVPAAEQCGWLKDKYSLSWQIVPIQMTQMLRDGSTEQVARLTHAFLKIKKFGFGRRASCRRRSDLTTGSSISPGSRGHAAAWSRPRRAAVGGGVVRGSRAGGADGRQ